MGYGWMGSVDAFLTEALGDWIAKLREHFRAVCLENPAGSQIDAWTESFAFLRTTFLDVTAKRPDAAGWTLVFEYELPREGGRRPDLVVLGGGSVLVVEFKEKADPSRADLDQVSAYARDLREYHEQSHGRTVVPVLLPRGQLGRPRRSMKSASCRPHFYQ